jgi:DNA repair photolyase
VEGAAPFRWAGLSAGDGDDGWFTRPARVPGQGAYAGLVFHEVHARSLLNRVPAPSRAPFAWSVNVYRGCSHACTYCFARPTHEYLGFDAGPGFDREIVVKVNALDVLRSELSPRRWGREHVAMGTNTDPYQAAEGRYRLTRGVVELLVGAATPFSILTKSTLVLRDLDVLAEASRRVRCWVDLSIGSLDEAVWRVTEPGAPAPWQRARAVARLRAAGIDCGVLVAPLQPDLRGALDGIERLLDALAEAGATTVTAMGVRLGGVVGRHHRRALRAHPELRASPAGGEDAAERVRLLAEARGLRWGARWRHEPAPPAPPSPPAGAVAEQLALPGFG